ncbi:hypothetical protein HpBhutan227_24170 [Helicobacter pylori]
MNKNFWYRMIKIGNMKEYYKAHSLNATPMQKLNKTPLLE